MLWSHRRAILRGRRRNIGRRIPLKDYGNCSGTVLSAARSVGIRDTLEVDCPQFTVIVVVQVLAKIMGFIVDAVSDVLTVAGADIQPTPDLNGQVDTTFLNGLAKAGEKLVILLDIDKVLTAAEAVRAAEAAGWN